MRDDEKPGPGKEKPSSGKTYEWKDENDIHDWTEEMYASTADDDP